MRLPAMSEPTTSVIVMTTHSGTPPTGARAWGAHASFAELGSPLRDQTFCVEDLESTAGSVATGSMIT